ncbi:DUF6115 domain-containing protein [Lentibacillus sp. Marseille-P4043]|uniref:DUF6115 domain-containing protein n=1 Tax=Lentibacillus sp. Marseille-P4043 TaxID=2040293 RepID=UPI000D0BDB57|nr:hypothetical protein [Lentibacillus sp. Marseille-P4043]
MTAFIFLISFLLHVITLAAIYQLLKQIKQLKQQKQNNTSEVMELFDTYLQEIKEENRMLEARLGNNDRKDLGEAQQATMRKNTPDPINQMEYADTTPDLPEAEADDSFETSLQARILQLYDQGYSHEEIASKLNCGKTEAELVIKLHGKNT